MSGEDSSDTLRDIQTLFNDGILGGLTDRQLLDRFVGRADSLSDHAFTILVERHGPMVWGVCRRVLNDRSAAADAFQATFLVLVRKASAVRVNDSLAPWLYGVSRRIAARERATTLRRQAREAGEIDQVVDPSPESDRSEWLAILDDEIGRLPERNRAAVVLCDLEGLPHEEAARRLGCPVGTVESRLFRGRRRLRERLVRRGIAPTAAALWAQTAREASAAIPATLVRDSTRLVMSSLATGALPVAVNTLADGVIKAMWFAKLKPLAAIAAVLVVTTTASVAVQGGQEPAPKGAGDTAKAATPKPSGAVDTVAPEIAANRKIAKEQLALIDSALQMLRTRAREGNTRMNDPAFSVWGQRKLETLRRAGATKAEIIAELQKYIQNLKEDHAMAVALHQQGRGTVIDEIDVRYRLMEAEIWLNEEKAR